jgi:hypothetical protein
MKPGNLLLHYGNLSAEAGTRSAVTPNPMRGSV